MGFLSEEGLERLVEKLSDGSNIKIAENPNGTRVGAVVDKLVEKTDTITGAVGMEIENTVGSFKVGTGLGSTDVSATVEDGFSEIDIKGNTVQNLVLEDNVEVVPSGTMVSAEATSLKLDTASGNVDMSIKGNTLQNLWDKGNDIFSIDLPNTGVNKNIATIKTHNDKDILYFSCDVKLYRRSTGSNPIISSNRDWGGHGKNTFISENHPINQTMKYSQIRTVNLQEGSTAVSVYFGAWSDANYKIDINNFKYINLTQWFGKGNEPTQEWCDLNLPSYVEGIQGVGEEVENGYEVEVKSCGKNIFDGTKVYQTGILPSTWPLLEVPIYVKHDTNYIISHTNNADFKYDCYDKLGNAVSSNLSWNNRTIKNFDSSVSFIKLRPYRYNPQVSFEESVHNLQIEEGKVETTYEPYIEDTLTYTLEEQLHRLPNGVCDEIKDGKLIRRIGKVILDGSESWGVGQWHNQNNTIGFQVENSSAKTYLAVCDRFIARREFQTDIECLYIDSVRFRIRINRDKLATDDINGFKQWLQANPTTVYYELATPVITELGQPTNLDTYVGTTHITSSNTVLPTMKVDSKGKPYNTLLKPNTDYTVKWSAANGGANLDLNLGGTAKTVDKTLGSTTVKTPTTLVDNNLYVAGWGSKVKDVMVAEGEHTNNPNLPLYVEGIQGVGDKIEILSNGKNLFDNVALVEKLKNDSNNSFSVIPNGFNMKTKSSGTWKATNYSIKLKANTKYTVSFDVKCRNTNGSIGSIKLWQDTPFSVFTDYRIDKDSSVKLTFTTRQTDSIFRIQLNTTRDVAGVGDIDIVNFMLVESDILSVFETYQEDKTQILLDEPLMKLPNGVCDEISNGKLIRRVGKIVLDSSSRWASWEGSVSQDMIGAYDITIPNISTANEHIYNLVSDNLPEVTRPRLSSANFNCIIRGSYYIGVALRKDALASPDANGLKQWLQANPTTVYYELKTPIITDLPQPVVRIFKDGHLSFATTAAPGSTHKVLLNKSAQIEDSVREIQSLDARVDRLEGFYDDMILETSHKLNLLDLDFDYIRESEEV